MIVAISPFSISTKSGHSLIDDDFYLEYLIESQKEFLFYIPKFSYVRLAKKFPNNISNLKLVRDYSHHWFSQLIYSLSLQIPRKSKVVFFGYSELLVLIICLLNIYKNFRLVLVSTNNFSKKRVNRNKSIIRLFLYLVHGKLEKIVLHTNYEEELLKGLMRGIQSKTIIKKHHLMISRDVEKTSISSNQITISYFGPCKSEKPLEPFIKLIKFDKDLKFKYNIYNVSEKEFIETSKLENVPKNVSISSIWLTEEEYYTRFNESNIIFLSHTSEFEGKLSGNLCDCVAFGVPFISPEIEPIISLTKQYGQIGYVYDFRSTNWLKKCIQDINIKSLIYLKMNIRSMSTKYTKELVWKDLDSVL